MPTFKYTKGEESKLANEMKDAGIIIFQYTTTEDKLFIKTANMGDMSVSPGHYLVTPQVKKQERKVKRLESGDIKLLAGAFIKYSVDPKNYEKTFRDFFEDNKAPSYMRNDYVISMILRETERMTNDKR
jgi:hypothetical protein